MKTSCACSLGLLGLLLAPVAFGASTGLEVDPPSDTGAACPTPRATSQQHLKVTAWELRDQTDGVGELVQKRAWLLLPGTGGFDLTGNVVDVQDVVTGAGTVYLRLAPLPGSRNWDGPDFRVKPGSAEGVEVVARDCRTLTIASVCPGTRRAFPVQHLGGPQPRRAAVRTVHAEGNRRRCGTRR